MSFTRQLVSVVAVAVFASAQADIINAKTGHPSLPRPESPSATIFQLPVALVA